MLQKKQGPRPLKAEALVTDRSTTASLRRAEPQETNDPEKENECRGRPARRYLADDAATAGASCRASGLHRAGISLARAAVHTRLDAARRASVLVGSTVGAACIITHND